MVLADLMIFRCRPRFTTADVIERPELEALLSVDDVPALNVYLVHLISVVIHIGLVDVSIGGYSIGTN